MKQITDHIMKRRSVRTFDGRKLSEEDLEKLRSFMGTIENPDSYLYQNLMWNTLHPMRFSEPLISLITKNSISKLNAVPIEFLYITQGVFILFVWKDV